MAYSLQFFVSVLFLVVTLGVTSGSATHGERAFLSKATANSSMTLYALISVCELPPFTPPSIFNISRIDPQTGLVVTSVYSTGQTCQLLQPVAPVADPRTRRAFVAAYHRNNWFDLWGEPSLSVFDLSNPDQAVPRQRIPLPIASYFIIAYTYSNMVFDAATNNVWLLSHSLEPGKLEAPFLVKVDLTKGVAYNVTSIAIPGLVWVPGQMQGGVFDAEARKLMLPLQTQIDGRTSNLILEYDVDAERITNITNTNHTAYSLVWDSTTGATYGFLSPNGIGLYYGVLQAGTWRILKQYPKYSGAGRMVLESATGLIYGGTNPSCVQTLHTTSDSRLACGAFVAIDVKSGDIRSATPLPDNEIDWFGLFRV